jgi:hypothetical protein
MIEFACKDVIFSFNKKHLEDSTVPVWILKTAGESFYVNHVECNVLWSTKETPESNHTKGSIKIKNCLLTIDDQNCASISLLTDKDKERLKGRKPGASRIIFDEDSDFQNVLKEENVSHSPFKTQSGDCGTGFVVCDLLNKAQITLLSLKYPDSFRILKPNEHYYQWYDKTPEQKKSFWKKIRDMLLAFRN